ncbi:MAG: type II toxin-antitoxin system VapC family toxin [Verrucomicrobiia bacterium]
MITLDASVWIAFFEKADPFNAASEEFLCWVRNKGLIFHSPEFALIETGCALARRMRDASFGRTAAGTIAKIPHLELVSSSRISVDAALADGCGHLLRGADAIYAATARFTRTQLITWDQELIERAGGVTPTTWLGMQT